MLNNKKRGLLASAGALVTAVALALGGAATAQAAPVDAMPDSSGLVITKLEQSGQGADTTGLKQTGLAGTPIAGVTFEAYQVPLVHNPRSNDGQQEIADITLAGAKALVAEKAANRSGKTDAAGEIHWDSSSSSGNLPAGLWLIRETGTPAGVVAAGDFLVALPLTNPTNLDQWLDTVYVYPKNHTVTGTKTVKNAEDFVVGDTVTWTISVDNPSPRDPATGAHVPADMLQIIDELDGNFLTTAADGSGVKIPGFVKDTDYSVTVAPGADNKTTVTIDFKAPGLAKIAGNAAAQVTLTLDTVIVQSGVVENSARFFSSRAQTTPKEIPGAEVKYGDFSLIKKSEGAPKDAKVNLAGAEFMVFGSEADARAAVKGDQAALKAALKPVVTVPGYNQKTGVWTTNAEGRVDITGLRYSAFADGSVITDTDKIQTYWLVETKALENHQLLAEPVSFLISGDVKAQTQTSQEIVNQYDRGGFVLPLTGGTGTLMLTVAGIALLAVVLIVARRRRHAAE